MGHEIDGLTHKVRIRVTQELDEVIAKTESHEIGNGGLIVFASSA